MRNHLFGIKINIGCSCWADAWAQCLLLLTSRFGIPLVNQRLCTFRGFPKTRWWNLPPVWGPEWGWCTRWRKSRPPERLPRVRNVGCLCSGCRDPVSWRARPGMGSQTPGWRLEKARRAEVWCGPLLGGCSSGKCHLLLCISVVDSGLNSTLLASRGTILKFFFKCCLTKPYSL